MTYNFVTDADIHAILKEEFKLGMTDSYFAGEDPSTFVKKAEKTALSQMKNRLAGRFNVDLLFTIPNEWSKALQYKDGERVRINDRFYIASADNSNVEPKPTSTIWTEDDPRDPMLVMFCCDILVYHLHARHNPRALTEIRVKRYDDALKELKAMEHKQENPPFPTIVDDPRNPLEYGFDMKERGHFF